MSNNETKCFFYGFLHFFGYFVYKSVGYCLIWVWCFLSKMLSALVIAAKNKKAHRIKPRWTGSQARIMPV